MIQEYILAFLGFINGLLIPLLIVVAFLVFLWNVVRYFIIGGSSEESQTKAKTYAVWSILAFVIMTGVWGIVNIFGRTFGFDNRSIIPDYMCERLGGDCRGYEGGMNDPYFQNGADGRYGNWRDYVETPGGSYNTQVTW